MFAEASYLTAAGVLLGAGLAAFMSRVAQSFVYRLPGVDITMLTAAPGMMTLVVAVAAIVPLRRALAVNPAIALRAE